MFVYPYIRGLVKVLLPLKNMSEKLLKVALVALILLTVGISGFFTYNLLSGKDSKSGLAESVSNIFGFLSRKDNTSKEETVVEPIKEAYEGITDISSNEISLGITQSPTVSSSDLGVSESPIASKSGYVEESVAKPTVAGVSTDKSLETYARDENKGKDLVVDKYNFSNKTELNRLFNKIKEGDIVYIEIGGRIYKVTTENREEIRSLIR